jgi:hypothetical protein
MGTAMKSLERFLFFVLMASVCGVCFGVTQKPNPANNTKPLTLCELVAQAEHYDRQTISVRAIVAVGAEQIFLYDPECRQGKDWTDVDFSKFKGRVPGKLKKLTKRDRRAFVVFEGIFYGPEPVQVDPKLPNWIKEAFKDSKQRYGHMNSLDTMIEVTAIKEVEEVPVSTLAPGNR